MLRVLLFVVCVSCCILFQQCNSFFASALPYQPSLTGRNELHTSVNVGAAGSNVGISYSPINHIYVGGIMHVYSGNSAHHISGGPIGGFYFNSADTNFHLNFLAGYQWGDVLFARVPLSGFGAYQGWQSQIFISGRIGKRHIRRLGVGVNFGQASYSYSRMHYTYNGPDSLYSELIVATGAMNFERSFPEVPELSYHLQFGISGALSDLADYSRFYMYHYFVLRVGVSYRFRPVKKG